jgi:metal-responsive CopG/Arc/MetJ family transcriptional regulator
MDKENVSKLIGIRVHPSLFEQFERRCKENYKTVSETVRELIVQYLNSNQSKPVSRLPDKLFL